MYEVGSVSGIEQRIVQLTEAKILPRIDNIYKESLRQMISTFGGLYYIDGNGNRIKVDCAHGNTERIAGRLKTDNNIVLPFITVAEVDSARDQKRERFSPVLMHQSFYDRDKQRAVRLLSLAPRAINITYEINLWCKYKADLDMLRSGVFSLFNPELRVPTNHSAEAKAFIDRERPMGSVAAADTKDRVLQKTVTIVLQTYIPSPQFLFTNTGEITEFNFNVSIDDG
tara:strand:+ start:1185 stop:1865 length:681 start_codon:yes stop_codon:yes gene_type:complete